MNLVATNNDQLTMSSREIAELVGKRHDHVLRDIQKMIDNPNLGFASETSFYKPNGTSRSYKQFLLPRRSCDLLVMSYSVEIQAKVYDRWQELESNQAPKIPQTYAEALQLAADQAKQLELAAPKVAFVDNLVERTNLLTATQVAQKHGKSAIWLNKILSEMKVYNRAVKRGKVFQQWFVDKGYGEMKKNEMGYDQPLFTNAGEVWINEQLFGEGLI